MQKFTDSVTSLSLPFTMKLILYGVDSSIEISHCHCPYYIVQEHASRRSFGEGRLVVASDSAL